MSAGGSYLTLSRGTPVIDRFEEPVGKVIRVLICEPGEHFDGVVIDTPAGKRFVDAPEVGHISDDVVRLCVAHYDVEHGGEPFVDGFPSAQHGRTEPTDEDRKAAIEALKHAYVHDAISTDDLAERVGGVYSAPTLDALEALLPH